jgi:hypothetical protein
MVRLFGLFAAATLLALPAAAPAQDVVIADYPAVVAPAPVATAYYVPVVVARPVVPVAAYVAPAVSYYSAPRVVTYRQPLLRPLTSVVRVRPGRVGAVAVYP